jgi:ketosteroid isomerase-like protein
MTRLWLACVALTTVVAVSASASAPTAAQTPRIDTEKIATEIKADMAQLIAAFNARDAAGVASHDAPNIVQMVSGRENIVGAEADLLQDRREFEANPKARTTLSAESVEVARSGEMAVFRATYTYNFEDTHAGRTTQEGNYVAGYKLQPDGSWKIEWAISAETGPSRPAAP